MRFIKMKNLKKEYGLNALAELPPAPDGEMLSAFGAFTGCPKNLKKRKY